MKKFDQWIAEVAKFPTGRIWLNNFFFDEKSGNLSPASVRELADAFESIKLTFPSYSIPSDIEGALIADFNRALIAKTAAFNLQCQRGPRGICVAYSFAIRVEAFLDRYVDKKRSGGLIKRRATSAADLLRVAEIYIKKRRFGGYAETGRPFFWATRTRNFEKLRKAHSSSPEELARLVRARGGLSHRLPGEGLVEVKIPRAKCKGKVIKAPSILDAGFPSGAFISSGDRRTGFGWTLNLDSYLKGFDEVVIERLPFDTQCDADIVGVIPAVGTSLLDLVRLEGLSASRIGFP